MPGPVFPRPCSSLPAIPSKSWTGLMACFLSILVFLVPVSWPFNAPQAAPSGPSFSTFYPRVGLGEGWKTSVVLVNIGSKATTVQLFPYDVNGSPLGEIPGGSLLLPGERRAYPQENDAFPERTAALSIRSDAPLFSFLKLESLTRKGLEVTPPPPHTHTPDPVLVFPLIGGRASWWSELSFQNTGPVETRPKIIAFDRDGSPLAEVLLPVLSPMAGTTVTVGDLFEASILASTATVQVMADQPLAGLELFGPDDSMDVASLPAPLGLGQRLFLPIFRDEKATLWTQVGLINPRDGPVKITVEAFDAQHRFLGQLPDLTSLPPHASHFFLTPDIAGSLPAETASIRITADQPISGYAVIGALQGQGQGLTAIEALTEKDSIVSHELIVSHDGNVLAAVPLMVMSDGTVQSAFQEVGMEYRKIQATDTLSLAGASRAAQSATFTNPENFDDRKALLPAAAAGEWLPDPCENGTVTDLDRRNFDEINRLSGPKILDNPQGWSVVARTGGRPFICLDNIRKNGILVPLNPHDFSPGSSGIPQTELDAHFVAGRGINRLWLTHKASNGFPIAVVPTPDGFFIVGGNKAPRLQGAAIRVGFIGEPFDPAQDYRQHIDELDIVELDNERLLLLFNVHSQAGEGVVEVELRWNSSAEQPELLFRSAHVSRFDATLGFAGLNFMRGPTLFGLTSLGVYGGVEAFHDGRTVIVEGPDNSTVRNLLVPPQGPGTVVQEDILVGAVPGTKLIMDQPQGVTSYFSKFPGVRYEDRTDLVLEIEATSVSSVKIRRAQVAVELDSVNPEANETANVFYSTPMSNSQIEEFAFRLDLAMADFERSTPPGVQPGVVFVSDACGPGKCLSFLPLGENFEILGPPTPLTDGVIKDPHRPSTSADGRFIIFDADDYKPFTPAKSSLQRIYILDRLLGKVRRSTVDPFGSANDLSATLSGDGRKFAMSTNRSGTYTLRILDANFGMGPGVGSSVAIGNDPDWSPVRDEVAFINGNALGILQVDSLTINPVTNRSSMNSPSFSPNGDRLAYAANSGIYVVNRDGSNDRQVLAAGGHPTWAGNDHLIVHMQVNGETDLFLVDLPTLAATRLTPADGINASEPAFVPFTSAPSSADTFDLTVGKEGTGSGTVASSPSGINCGTDCMEPYGSDTTVTLTATPVAGSTFDGWSGDCAGQGNPCLLTMTSPKSTTANFTAPLVTITLTPTGPTTIAPGDPMGFSLTVKSSGGPFPIRLQLLLLPGVLGREISLMMLNATLPAGTAGPVPLSISLPRVIQLRFPGRYTFIGRLWDSAGVLLSESRVDFTVPARVTIQDFSFAPWLIDVRVGDTIQWSNNGTITHTTTSNAGVWDSGSLAPGTSWDQAFANAGSFLYHCKIHPQMVGGVIVHSNPLAGSERAMAERRLKKGVNTKKLREAIWKGLRQ